MLEGQTVLSFSYAGVECVGKLGVAPIKIKKIDSAGHEAVSGRLEGFQSSLVKNCGDVLNSVEFAEVRN